MKTFKTKGRLVAFDGAVKTITIQMDNIPDYLDLNDVVEIHDETKSLEQNDLFLRQMTEYIDSMTPAQLCRKLQGYGMKFTNLPPDA